MRGFGRRRFFSSFRTPSSCPSPLRGEGTQRARYELSRDVAATDEAAPRDVRHYLRRASAATRRNSAATSALLPADQRHIPPPVKSTMKNKHNFIVLAARFVCVRVFPKPRARKATPRKSGAPGGAGVVGHATRTDVATRPRFGRGARHRTIRLREPPASGALRLPALHHHRGSPPRLSTAAARVPLPLPPAGVVNRRPYGEREDSLSY